jgi:tetratricopeptide (TPR) repeat protein
MPHPADKSRTAASSPRETRFPEPVFSGTLKEEGKKQMTRSISAPRRLTVLSSVAVAALAVVAPAKFALAQQNSAPSGQSQPKPGSGAQQAAPAGKPDPAEEAAYKAFYDANQQDADKKIQLGEDFIQKYPSSHYDESVYAVLVQAYLTKQDWTKFGNAADNALSLNPDDVSVLTTVGWVIPHTFNPNDPNAAANLDKAEKYEKHAIDLLGTLPKPANMTDDQFAQSKAEELVQAHSGLGLVYFRRQQFDDSSKELQQATQSASTPDPTDFFVLGVDYENLKKNSDAANAFDRCAQIPGGLQDRCKQESDKVKKAK